MQDRDSNSPPQVSPAQGNGEPCPTSPHFESAPSPEPPLASPEVPPDLHRLGKYRLLKKIGHGGMGVVYKALDTALNRNVALKLISDQDQSAEAVARFKLEAKAIAQIRHNHVVHLNNSDDIVGTFFIDMPLLSGQSLHRRLQQTPQLPLADLVKIGREMAEGLAAVHDAGLVHRDIKPGNVFLSEENGGWQVRLLDLGLARDIRADAQLTIAGSPLGTPQFMSPEQARRETVDKRSDLFSLGVVLYRIATGINPFVGDDLAATVHNIITVEPPPVETVRPDVPKAMSRLIAELMAKNPDDRPQSAREFVDRWRAAAVAMPSGGGQDLAETASFKPGPRRRKVSRKVVSVVAGMAVLLLFGGAYHFWTNSNGQDSSKGQNSSKGQDNQLNGHHAGLATPGGAPSQPLVPPLTLDLQLFATKKGNLERLFTLNELNVLPLKADDGLRIEVRTARPAYLYVLNMDAEGKVWTMHPWLKNDWTEFPDDEKPRTFYCMPDPARIPGDAATLTPGPSGIEAIVVLAREKPLTSAEKDQLREMVKAWPKYEGQFDKLRAAVSIGADEIRFGDTRDEKRGAVDTNNTIYLKDPVVRLRRLLQTDIRNLGVVSRGVCYPFFEGP